MRKKFFDPVIFRRSFPALNDGAIYLDNAATTLKPEVVIQTLHQHYSGMTSTVHRSQHAAARALTLNFEQTRHQVAKFINAPNATDIVWTQGATEAINLVAQSYARPRLQPGDEIIVSEAEHHANLVPWLMVARQTGARVIKLPVGTNRLPDLDKLPDVFTGRTRLLALGQMSNVTGGRPCLVRATEFAHRHNCVVIIDGAQGIVHGPVDVKRMDIDFYAFSAHKLYGPEGTGVLYGRSDLLADMPPWQGGGKMLTQASFDGFVPEAVPYRFEAGTPNIAGITGFSAVLRWLEGIDLIAAEHYSQGLARRAEEKLSALPGFRSFRCPDSSILAFEFTDSHHSDLATLLSEQGIALRSGQHCAQPLCLALGTKGCLRASFAPYNTIGEVDALYSGVEHALSLLRN